VERLGDGVCEGPEVLRVLAVVRDQGIERVVVAAFVLAPEPDGVPAREVRAVALDPDFLLDRLQPSRESDPLAGVHEIEVGRVDPMSKAVSRKGTSNRAPLNVASRLASANCLAEPLRGEILAGDERGRLPVPVEAHRRHPIAVFVEAGRLDVEKAGLLARKFS